MRLIIITLTNVLLRYLSTQQNKNGKNVSFSLSQIKTSGDTISTQYPTPRKHEAYKKLAGL